MHHHLRRQISNDNNSFTTGNGFFAIVPGHMAKTLLHTVKASPSAAHDEANTTLVLTAISRAYYIGRTTKSFFVMRCLEGA
jgi:hypothetical protein